MRERHLDAVVEAPFFAALLVKLHQSVHIGGARRTPECLCSKVSNDFPGACVFICCVRRTAHKDLAAAWRILSLLRIERTFDPDCADMRKVCEAGCGTRLYRVAHEVLIEVQHRRKIGLQKRYAERMRSGSCRKANAHSTGAA